MQQSQYVHVADFVDDNALAGVDLIDANPSLMKSALVSMSRVT